MRFRASDVYDYYRPSKCARRVALRARGVPEDTADTPFDELLRGLGLRHERAHLAALSGVVDLSSPEDKPKERERLTLAAIREGAAAIYQPRFRTEVTLDGELCELVGEPDFLVGHPDGAGYFIRDSKLARKPTSGRHVAISLQLQIYGLLYERTAGERPRELQVHAGTGDIVRVPYDGQAPVIEVLGEHRRMRLASPDTYEPVGWTKCNGCGFYDRCWGRAAAAGDVALLTTVNQERARGLHARGIATIRALPAAIDDPAHGDFFREGKKDPHLRGFVPGLRRSAEAFLSGLPIVIAAPDLPDADDCVMLDLEGLPAYLDDLEKIYLWGIKDDRGVFRFLPALAGFGPEGDRAGWQQFLAISASLLAERPNLRFVHWGNYEQTKITGYIERYGDASLPLAPGEVGLAPAPSGTAGRILDRLVDLLTVVRSSVVLPLPSYGLKVVEKFVGFERRLTEYQGNLAMARYIQACETSDPATREEIMSEILAYNEEDLDATLAVMDWLRKLLSRA